MENLSDFQEKVKLSFKKAKEDISSLKKELNENKQLILAQNNKIELLLQKLQEIIPKPKINKEKPMKKDESSIGNEGVYSFIHSFNSYAHPMHAQKLHDFRKNLEADFHSLSKQEFLTFLTIYQLEEDLGNISYSHIAQHLKLSEGCIRTYVSSLIKKNMPLIKEKVNNKFIILRISEDFRNLNLKSKLLDLYNQVDPAQKRLFDGF